MNIQGLLCCGFNREVVFWPSFVVSSPRSLVIPVLFIVVSSIYGWHFRHNWTKLLMTWAYKKNNAAPIALASYIGPVFAVGADLIAFDVLPTANVYIGGSIVVLSGIALIKSKKYRRNVSH